MQESGGGDQTVVLVEDDAELADLYRQYLQDAFTVTTVPTGEAALARIDDAVDVALLDRSLPDMDGQVLLSELRARGLELPVAMVAAAEPDADVVDLAFDDYLEKPVDRAALRETVRRLTTQASFEATSRQLFRLAAKRESVSNSASTAADGGMTAMDHQIEELRAELDETLASLVEPDATPGRSTRPTVGNAEATALLSDVMGHSLPSTVQDFIDEYQSLPAARPPFMWKWVHQLAPQNTLPCVDETFRERVPVDKTLLILFVTVLDDLLEKQQDRATFTALSRLPFGSDVTADANDAGESAVDVAAGVAGTVDGDYMTFGRRLWATIQDRLASAPKFDEFEALFYHDLRQAISAIEYSNIAIQRPDLSTMGDLTRYESHNMVLFAYADIDLMHSDVDVRDEFDTIREVVWTAQLMARIGNWVSTWERELREGDFSAGPIVRALEADVISDEELTRARAQDDTELKEELIDRIKANGFETEFLQRWERRYQELVAYDDELSAFDLEPFIQGTEEVLRYHLASTGVK